MSVPPRVCVALSVRDGERYLAEAVESVLSQQEVELELRIYDNGSSDGSLELARSYQRDPRVHVAENPEGTSYFGSLNRALAETEAPYLAPFACDDLMRPGNLARKVAALDDTGAAFAHSVSEVIDGEGRVERIWCDYASAPPLAERGAFFAHMAPVNTTILMAAVCRSDELRSCGGFDERLVYCGDWLALLRLSLRGRVVTIHEPLVGYRRHAEAGTNVWHARRTWVGELVSALALALSDPDFPTEWRGSAAGLFAGCLGHCARELAGQNAHRTDASGVSAYACAARAAALLPGESRALEAFAALLAAAGFTARAPFTLLAPAPDSQEDAVKLLARCDSLAAAGIGAAVRIGCSKDEVERIAALLEEGCAQCPTLDVTLIPTADSTALLEPGCIALYPADREELVAQAEAVGVPVLAYDLPGPLGEAWEAQIEAAVVRGPAQASDGPAAQPLPEPSATLRSFTADFPWERGTILSFIQRATASLPRGARVLDVGAGEAPYRELFSHLDYLTTDWENSVHPGARRVDFVGSADDLPIPDRCFDAVVNTQVLEHVSDPAAVLREIHRVLVPGGRFFLTVPLVWELHEEPYDFYRYTKYGLAHLLAQAGFVDVVIEPRNDCFTTIAQLMRNVAAAVGSRADGLDPQRALAAHTMRGLADLVATYAPLDTQWIMPLGYSVTAARAGVAAGRFSCGLEGARSAIVLALADEVAERPELLAAFSAALPEHADVTLAVLAGPGDATANALPAGLDRSSLAERRTAILSLPGEPRGEFFESLAPLAHGLLSRREPPAPLAGLPSLRDRSERELVSAALHRSR